jgi:DUF1680 family protein
MRLVASLGHYVATRDDAGLQVHQYAPARIATALPSGPSIALRLETRYPWDGAVRATVEEAGDRAWSLALRVPGWCPGATVRVNGAGTDPALDAGGYIRLERRWRAGDVIELDLPMAARLVEAHPAVESTRGCLAIERGPLVYCVEEADHAGTPIAELEIDPAAPLTTRWEPDLLEGVVTVGAAGARADAAAWAGHLYRPYPAAPPPRRTAMALTAIPYYAWANRDPGAMRVWVPRRPA